MSKETPPGFLSKVARFVKKPMTNWTDLDQPEPDKSTDYSKALLKEMIERKRRNDFVRKREFDQLRKLRSRGSTMPSALEAPSFFQSSLPSNPEERAHTLRKIDEIEAQMSKQWWKSKSPNLGATANGDLSPAVAAASRAIAKTELQAFGETSTVDAAPAQPSFALQDTVPLSLSARESIPTAPLNQPPFPFADANPLLAPVHWQGAETEPQEASGTGAGFVHDPELEEPAIRFANGDYEGAEAALAALIAPGAEGIDRPSIWLALFDLYRATGQHDRFESIALDFAARFGRSEPVWFAFADARDAGPGQGAAGLAKLAAPSRAFGWSAPEVLTAKVVATLDTALSKGPLQPWRFNWGKLGTVEPDAHGPLLQLFERWCASAVRLRFVDADQLERVLAAQIPSGDDSVDPVCWRLALELRRVMQQTDDFDRLALDYCITYEVSPPSWVDPVCTFLQGPDDAGGAGQATSALGPDSLIQSEFFPSLPAVTEPAAQSTTVAMFELSGRLVGDAGDRLVGMDQSHPGVKSLTVRCDKLARVDFSAAGSVLNWAAARQADGCRVEFSQLQRLVAIFFNVVGISEYAQVSVRHN